MPKSLEEEEAATSEEDVNEILGSDEDSDAEKDNVAAANEQLSVEERRLFKQKIREEHAKRYSLLLDTFTDEQLNRYETYRSCGFSKSGMKRVLQDICGEQPHPRTVILMKSVAKVYCGEIIETARDVQEDWGDEGALQPKHIREAVRQMKKYGRHMVAGERVYSNKRFHC